MTDVPVGIPADGSVDVSDLLTVFFASVPDGDTVVFPEGGRYRIERTVQLVKRNGLTIEGNGAELFADTPGIPSFGRKARSLQNRSHLKFVGGSDLEVENLRITGANPNPGGWSPKYNSQHGIMLCGVDGAIVTGNVITDVYGDGVYLGNEKPGKVNSPCEGIFVTGNMVRGAGRQGMTCNYGQGVWFDHNDIDDVAFAAFDFEPDSHKTPCSDIHVIGNRIGSHGGPFLAARGRAPVDYVEIAENVSEVAALGIQVGNDGQAGNVCTRWSIHDNRCSAPNPAARYFGFTCVDDVQVFDNDLRVHGIAVRVNACNRVQVYDNNFRGAKAALDVRQPGERWYAGPSTECTESANDLTKG